MTYLHNLRAWWRGFDRFAEITFDPGWGPEQRRWWWLYAVNHGTRVLAGGACMPWSRWFYLHRERYPVAKLITRLLNLVDDDHGKEAGPALWGTRDTSWAAAGAVVFWLTALVLVVALLAGAARLLLAVV